MGEAGGNGGTHSTLALGEGNGDIGLSVSRTFGRPPCAAGFWSCCCCPLWPWRSGRRSSFWDQSGETTQSRYGFQIFALGDQNDDGFADWGVVSFGNLSFDSVYSRVDLFRGGNPPPSTPFLSFTAAQGPAVDIRYADAVGDLNGDGYTDWMLWKRHWPVTWQYAVEIYSGGADGLPETVFHMAVGSVRVTGMGDFNCDGYDDLFIDHATYSEVCFGSAVFDTVADWRINQTAQYPYLAFAQSFGDLNGDHCRDYVGSDPSRDYFHAVYGGAQPDTLPDVVWTGYQDDPTRVVPDLNGDGFDDLITGTLGALRVHLGGPLLSQTPTYTLTFSGCQGASDAFPGIGDVNDDGFQDLAAVNSTACELGWGKVAVYLGHSWLNPDPVLEFYGGSSPLFMAGMRKVVGLGDVNGDGVEDFAVGADGGSGRVVVISGNPDIQVAVEEPHPVAQDFHVAVYPNPFNSRAEIRYVLPRSSRVSLKVFDVMGREVGVLVDEVVRAGEGRVVWKAEGVASGVYFVRFASGGMGVTRKVLLVR